ncbi:hypothetical protein LSH36_4g16005 [Paralvinella palmiformis]|uniref:Uncharacterized protein n=1 Tax=Paralvinella palmiformis TaxID=53620 RepID=A0AAD9KEF6_9ANNE|nr:hypothetical protein LSH36_4g16005 [Paralvinella palmiformis]
MQELYTEESFNNFTGSTHFDAPLDYEIQPDLSLKFHSNLTPSSQSKTRQDGSLVISQLRNSLSYTPEIDSHLADITGSVQNTHWNDSGIHEDLSESLSEQLQISVTGLIKEPMTDHVSSQGESAMPLNGNNVQIEHVEFNYPGTPTTQLKKDITLISYTNYLEACAANENNCSGFGSDNMPSGSCQNATEASCSQSHLVPKLWLSQGPPISPSSTSPRSENNLSSAGVSSRRNPSGSTIDNSVSSGISYTNSNIPDSASTCGRSTSPTFTDDAENNDDDDEKTDELDTPRTTSTITEDDDDWGIYVARAEADMKKEPSMAEAEYKEQEPVDVSELDLHNQIKFLHLRGPDTISECTEESSEISSTSEAHLRDIKAVSISSSENHESAMDYMNLQIDTRFGNMFQVTNSNSKDQTYQFRQNSLASENNHPSDKCEKSTKVHGDVETNVIKPLGALDSDVTQPSHIMFTTEYKTDHANLKEGDDPYHTQVSSISPNAIFNEQIPSSSPVNITEVCQATSEIAMVSDFDDNKVLDTRAPPVSTKLAPQTSKGGKMKLLYNVESHIEIQSPVRKWKRYKSMTYKEVVPRKKKYHLRRSQSEKVLNMSSDEESASMWRSISTYSLDRDETTSGSDLSRPISYECLSIVEYKNRSSHEESSGECTDYSEHRAHSIQEDRPSSAAESVQSTSLLSESVYSESSVTLSNLDEFSEDDEDDDNIDEVFRRNIEIMTPDPERLEVMFTSRHQSGCETELNYEKIVQISEGEPLPEDAEYTSDVKNSSWSESLLVVKLDDYTLDDNKRAELDLWIEANDLSKSAPTTNYDNWSETLLVYHIDAMNDENVTLLKTFDRRHSSDSEPEQRDDNEKNDDGSYGKGKYLVHCSTASISSTPVNLGCNLTQCQLFLSDSPAGVSHCVLENWTGNVLPIGVGTSSEFGGDSSDSEKYSEASTVELEGRLKTPDISVESMQKVDRKHISELVSTVEDDVKHNIRSNESDIDTKVFPGPFSEKISGESPENNEIGVITVTTPVQYSESLSSGTSNKLSQGYDNPDLGYDSIDDGATITDTEDQNSLKLEHSLMDSWNTCTGDSATPIESFACTVSQKIMHDTMILSHNRDHDFYSDLAASSEVYKARRYYYLKKIDDFSDESSQNVLDSALCAIGNVFLSNVASKVEQTKNVQDDVPKYKTATQTINRIPRDSAEKLTITNYACELVDDVIESVARYLSQYMSSNEEAGFKMQVNDFVSDVINQAVVAYEKKLYEDASSECEDRRKQPSCGNKPEQVSQAPVSDTCRVRFTNETGNDHIYSSSTSGICMPVSYQISEEDILCTTDDNSCKREELSSDLTGDYATVLSRSIVNDVIQKAIRIYQNCDHISSARCSDYDYHGKESSFERNTEQMSDFLPQETLSCGENIARYFRSQSVPEINRESSFREQLAEIKAFVQQDLTSDFALKSQSKETDEELSDYGSVNEQFPIRGTYVGSSLREASASGFGSARTNSPEGITVKPDGTLLSSTKLISGGMQMFGHSPGNPYLVETSEDKLKRATIFNDYDSLSTVSSLSSQATASSSIRSGTAGTRSITGSIEVVMDHVRNKTCDPQLPSFYSLESTSTAISIKKVRSPFYTERTSVDDTVMSRSMWPVDGRVPPFFSSVLCESRSPTQRAKHTRSLSG